MSIDQIIDLLPIDPEIERTFRQRRRQVNRKRTKEMNFENQNQNQGGAFAYNTHNLIIVTDDKNCAIWQYAIPLFNKLNPSIVRPEIEAPQFELKPIMFQILQNMGQFSGIPTEDPHLHLQHCFAPFIINGAPRTFDNHLLVLHRLVENEDPIEFGAFLGSFMEYDVKQISKGFRGYMKIRVSMDNYERFPREGIRMGSIIESSKKEAYTTTSVWLREEDERGLFGSRVVRRTQMGGKRMEEVEDVPILEIDGKKRPRVFQPPKGRLTKRNENLKLECSRVGEPLGM
ncbi:hypothetical protein Goshw_022308 [Gossypium schwendimanii]|uniref:Uncharacterized protein n=1 Tax=Gossypium schwendimanii TaxID=34291 RepID=A0A7J9NBM9_GOSSC|nr:hypothetical protein [Gossypium schwendimanii]